MSNNTEATCSKADDDTRLSEEQRRQYIEVAAYHIAEKSKSDQCCDLDNWLAAEAEIDQLLAKQA